MFEIEMFGLHWLVRSRCNFCQKGQEIIKMYLIYGVVI